MAQKFKTPEYIIEAGSSFSLGKETPFWLLSNQYGLLTPNKYNTWLNTGFHSKPDSLKKIDYDYGFDLVNRYSSSYDLYIHQGYARIKLWFLNIQVGKIEETFGNQDSQLSSGGILWSGNARPMPKFTINVPRFTPVPFTKGYLEFKGGISHGWFDNNKYIKNVWLHHKYVYIQAGGKFPINIHYGFHHFAQWGGKTSDPEIGNLPSGLPDFIKVFFAKSGEGSTSTPIEESYNKIGNHIGSKNYGIDLILKKYKISAYWQTIFEDGSGKAGRNIEDGLWGVAITTTNKKSLINKIVLEFINTTDQSAPFHGVDSLGDIIQSVGPDNYFNNGFYIKGWTYQNMTLGTPLLTSPAIIHGTAEFKASQYLINNRVKAFHCGINGNIQNISYKVLYTYSINNGTYSFPLNPEKKQHSILTEAQIRNLTPWNLNLGLALGFDSGTMYGDNFGIQIKLIKTGMF